MIMASRWAVTFIIIGAGVALCCLISSTEACVHSLWWNDIPKSGTYNDWSARTNFTVNDSILFFFPESSDFSALEVREEDYKTCNVQKPMKKYWYEGEHEAKLEQSGYYYFIAGKDGSCVQEGVRMVVYVPPLQPNQPVPPPSQLVCS